MKGCLGIIQIALGIGGIIALINGEWGLMLGAWIGASVVGFLGNSYVKATEGVSQLGQDAMDQIQAALFELRQGNYAHASRLSSSAVQSIRIGRDQLLLPLALQVQATALGATQDIEGAKRAVAEAFTQL